MASVSNISIYLGSNEEGIEFQKEIEQRSLALGVKPSVWIRELVRKELDKQIQKAS